MRPIQSYKVQGNLTEISQFFSKIVKLSSTFWKFWYQIDEAGPIFKQILDNFENMTHAEAVLKKRSKI